MTKTGARASRDAAAKAAATAERPTGGQVAHAASELLKLTQSPQADAKWWQGLIESGLLSVLPYLSPEQMNPNVLLRALGMDLFVMSGRDIWSGAYAFGSSSGRHPEFMKYVEKEIQLGWSQPDFEGRSRPSGSTVLYQLLRGPFALTEEELLRYQFPDSDRKHPFNGALYTLEARYSIGLERMVRPASLGEVIDFMRKFPDEEGVLYRDLPLVVLDRREVTMRETEPLNPFGSFIRREGSPIVRAGEHGYGVYFHPYGWQMPADYRILVRRLRH